jgi:hypothetical protein
MTFKLNSIIITCCVVLLGLMISCNQYKESPKQPSVESDLPGYTDSLVFKTSSSERVYLAERLYPSGNSDSSSLNGTEPGILSIEGVGDTVFVFLNNEALYDRENNNLPLVNDSLIRHHYPKYYKVEIDDDLPYMVYLKSPKDLIQFIRNKHNVYYLESAVVGDTVLSVFNKVKVGMRAEKVLAGLELPIHILTGIKGKIFQSYFVTDRYRTRPGSPKNSLRSWQPKSQQFKCFSDSKRDGLRLYG